MAQRRGLNTKHKLNRRHDTSGILRERTLCCNWHFKLETRLIVRSSCSLISCVRKVPSWPLLVESLLCSALAFFFAGLDFGLLAGLSTGGFPASSCCSSFLSPYVASCRPEGRVCLSRKELWQLWRDRMDPCSSVGLWTMSMSMLRCQF